MRLLRTVLHFPPLHFILRTTLGVWDCEWKTLRKTLWKWLSPCLPWPCPTFEGGEEAVCQTLLLPSKGGGMEEKRKRQHLSAGCCFLHLRQASVGPGTASLVLCKLNIASLILAKLDGHCPQLTWDSAGYCPLPYFALFCMGISWAPLSALPCNLQCSVGCSPLTFLTWGSARYRPLLHLTWGSVRPDATFHLT